jgi:hypothetical protein
MCADYLVLLIRSGGRPRPSVYREIQPAEQGGLITSRKISSTRLARPVPSALDTAAAQLAGAEDDDGRRVVILSLVSRQQPRGNCGAPRLGHAGSGVEVAGITQLTSQFSSRTTKAIYQCELRTVITTGTGAMDEICIHARRCLCRV